MYNIEKELMDLQKVYKESSSLTQLEKKVRDIPLEIREEVLNRFNLFLIKDTLEFLKKSPHPLHKNFNEDTLSDVSIEMIANNFNDNRAFDRILNAAFDENQADIEIIKGSFDSFLKLSNQVKIDTIVFKLENSLYDKNFDIVDFHKQLSGEHSDEIRKKLTEYMKINIFEGRNENKFNGDQLNALNLLDAELGQLAIIKRMDSSLERAEYLSHLVLSEKSYIKPELFNIDDNVLIVAQECKERGIDLESINYDFNVAQSAVVDDIFLKNNIDKNRFLGQVYDVDLFLNEFKSNFGEKSFSIPIKIARDDLLGGRVASESEYNIDFCVKEDSKMNIEVSEIGSNSEKLAFVIPKLQEELVNEYYKGYEDMVKEIHELSEEEKKNQNNKVSL